MDKMEIDTRKAFEQELYVFVIMSLLVIPDLCAALESCNGDTNGPKYRKWCDKYFIHKYKGNLSSMSLYKLRCSMLHQGSINVNQKNEFRILFQPPMKTATQIIMHNCIGGGMLTIYLERFMNDIFESYKDWQTANLNNRFVKENVRKNGLHFSKNEVSNLIGYNDGILFIC